MSYNALSHKLVKNAGAYNHRIVISKVIQTKDAQGFPVKQKQTVLKTWANIKTTRGMTIIVNNSDFEKALTNFTIRFPKTVIARNMLIDFNKKTYSIQYINNINKANVELEIQAKEITH